MANKAGNHYSAKGCRNWYSLQKLSFFGYPKEIDRRNICMENCGNRILADDTMKSDSFMFLGF